MMVGGRARGRVGWIAARGHGLVDEEQGNGG